MKKILLFFGLLLLLSCSNEENEITDTKQNDFSISKDPNFDLKKSFSTALAKALAESQDVRTLIKNEALKKIDHDYDVLYQLVKDEKLSDGSTLESLMSKYIEPDKLALINEKMPTLTIFVPELPEKTFSADLWDVNNEVPVVGYRTSATNNIPFVDAEGVETIIDAQLIPGFPIVVVKENERIAVKTNGLRSTSQSNLKSATNSNTDFIFIDEIFDNTKPSLKKNEAFENSTRAAASTVNLTPKYSKLLSAFDTYNVSTNGWQRDYLYYNVTPSKPKGTFEHSYMEHVVGFELIGDPMTALGKISDQPGQDPTGYTGTDRANLGKPLWTDGEFEFKIKIQIASKEPYSNENIKLIRIAPEDLFSPVYASSGGRGRSYFTGKYTLKKVDLSQPLFEWNLENYGASYKITIEEVDNSQTEVKTETTSVEFATNFEYNVSLGEKEKIGMKFGASKKETRTVVFQISTAKGNDELGDVIINFSDPVILSKNWSYYYLPSSNTGGGRGSGGTTSTEIDYSKIVFNLDYNTKYNSGWYRVYIAPLKIY